MATSHLPTATDMESFFQPIDQTVLNDTQKSMILCCQCGTLIESNSANMCVACLRTQVDITEGIPKQSTLYLCKGCERYHQPPSAWVEAALESKELMAVCLKRLKGLNKVRLIDAGFIWTEPHSKRIKVKLVIQKEVLNSTILQQVFTVEYVVHGQMCDDCHKREAKDHWKALVQVRQKASHKKTFLYLEQLILKHNAHQRNSRIKESKDGLDFYYSQKQDARKLVDFITSVVPSRYKMSQELVSHDTHSNTYNYKHTFAVEIVPVCKDNVVCLPKKLAQSLGNIGQIVVCTKVTSYMQIVDPATLQYSDISSLVFWRTPFNALFDHRQMTQFLVLQLEVSPPSMVASHSVSKKCVLADVWVSPLPEMDRQIHCRTHLGHVLNPGDTVWGYDFTRANFNNEHIEKLKQHEIPDVVLIKKCFGSKKKRHKKRNWHLQSMKRDMTSDGGSVMEDGEDYLDFLEDIEEDQTIRQGINIYKKEDFVPVTFHDSDDDGEGVCPDAPEVSVEEMLQNLTIDS